MNAFVIALKQQDILPLGGVSVVAHARNINEAI
jgi:hypothetical protein